MRIVWPAAITLGLAAIGAALAPRGASDVLAKSALGLNARIHFDDRTGDVPTRGGDREEHEQVDRTLRAASTASVAQYGIQYHNGPVMTGGVRLYTIWYGDWSASTSQAVINGFLGNLSGSAWYGINGTYTDGSGRAVTPAVTLTGSTVDNYTYGKALGDRQVASVVSNAISSRRLPLDANGVYLVLTSKDVSETSGFLTRYCGWHWYQSISRTPVKYAFVGDPSARLSACAAQSTASPNANPAADAMISVIAHEIAEAATDPLGTAWYDATGAENADKCSWTYGATSVASNGSRYNLTLGGVNYLVQQNWKNLAPSGACALG